MLKSHFTMSEKIGKAFRLLQRGVRTGDFGYKLLGKPQFAHISTSAGMHVIKEPVCGLRAELGFQGSCKSMLNSPSCSIVTVPNAQTLLHNFPELRVELCAVPFLLVSINSI